MAEKAHYLFDLALRRAGFPERSQLGKKRILLGREIEEILPSIKFQRIQEESSSEFRVQYHPDPSLHSLEGKLSERAFRRYDFTEEWNNQGYGAITLHPSDDPFSCPGWVTLPEFSYSLASVVHQKTGTKVSDYAAIIETEDSLYLWFNRNVGPIDGFDWVFVENFLSQGLNPLPCLSEIPFGYEGAVTMRIDCDESVRSGRALFELYKQKQFPFSMAIKTQQPLDSEDHQLMRDVLASGGAVVGHSHTHAPQWGGGSSEKALWEIQESHRVLKSLGIDGINYDYVVSPFHQNPTESVRGLSEAGIRGFVGGIICNDPEYLVARSGRVPDVHGIITHSQQCMLHGDTYHEAGNRIDGYKEAFERALQTSTFFGFLDHPFSNYWYGWASEEERLAVHEEFLNYLSSFNRLWRANLVEALRFLEMKSTVVVSPLEGGEGYEIHLPKNSRFEGLPTVGVKWKNQIFELKMGETIVIK